MAIEDHEKTSVLLFIYKNGMGVILDAPIHWFDEFDGIIADDNNFENMPTQPGLYRCEVEFVVTSGHWNYSYEIDPDWEFRIVSTQKIKIEGE